MDYNINLSRGKSSSGGGHEIGMTEYERQYARWEAAMYFWCVGARNLRD